MGFDWLPVIMVSSISLQFVSAGLAVVLIAKSGFRRPWIPLSAAVFLMGLRRLLSFLEMLERRSFPDSAFSPELIALAISVLMAYGLTSLYGAFTRQKKRNDAELERKDVLIEETRHRAKNELQMLSSVITLKRHMSGDEAERAILQDLSLRVQSFALVEQSLFDSARGRSSTVAYLTRLVNGIASAHSGSEVRLILDIDELSLSAKDLQRCGILVNEAVTNAYKHAFAGIESPSIEVSLKREGDSARLSVSDNGVGLAGNGDGNGVATFGMTLIRGIGTEPGWKVSIKSGSGVEITARVPLVAEALNARR